MTKARITAQNRSNRKGRICGSRKYRNITCSISGVERMM
jgi:hypothetical protein